MVREEEDEERKKGRKEERKKEKVTTSSACPPISPIMMMPSVSGSFVNASRQSMKLVPLSGSPPMPTQVVWPSPASVVCATASYVRVPDLIRVRTQPQREVKTKRRKKLKIVFSWDEKKKYFSGISPMYGLITWIQRRSFPSCGCTQA